MFLVLAGAFVASALALPPQLRLFSILSSFVAGLLVICSLAAWRAQRPPRPVLPARTVRRISIAQWLITALAWAWPVALYAYAGVAWAVVGHWPSYGRPDPEDLGLPVLHGSVAIGFYASGLGILLWVLCFPLCSRALGARGVRLHVLVFVLGIGMLALMLFQDLGGVFNWYAD